jgi:prephenate dehydrogenase
VTVHFDTVTIIGVGLLGGSLGLALKTRNLAGTIRGVGRREATLAIAAKVGAVDETSLDAAQACTGADLVVICTPAALVPKVLDEIAPACSTTAVVTDVASTKDTICTHAKKTWPSPLRFVGSHPMAGSEKYGPEHSDPELYEGCVTIVEDHPDADAQAQNAVRELWEAVGARVVPMAPNLHDSMVARTSHVPHIAAGCIAQSAAELGDVHAVAATGFRDVTRVAAGRAEIWRDICLTNQKAIATSLVDLGQRVAAVEEMVARGDGEELMAFFRAAQEARAKALGGE